MATINGTAGNDTLVGTTSTDTISGLGGNDRLQGSGGNDSVLGGAGNDFVFGNDGTDWLEGGAGNDNVGGGGGQDSFVFREAGSTTADVFNDFSSGWDNIQLDAAFFTTLGAAGQFTSGDARFWSSSTGTAHDADDRIIYNTSTRQLWYDADGNGSGAALLIGTLNTGATVIATDIRVFGAPSGGSGQTINGTSGNDSLVGGSGNDTINGFAGEDTINGGAGADSMVGGTHPDTYFVDNPGDVIVELEDGGFDTVNASVSYTLAAWVNHLTLTGTAAINGNGNELPNLITGNSGDNDLAGGAGNDTLNGGAGPDTFIFRETGAGNADSVNDFSSGSDKLLLDGAVMSALGAAGNFAAGDARFAANTSGTAQDASDRVIYQTDTRQIWYDADGNGAGARQLIATLQSGATLVATDVAVEGGSSGGGQTINGTPNNDSLVGGSGNDTINGFGGNDTLVGLGGDDSLVGGTGFDSMDGGLGNDTYVTESEFTGDENDSITDAGGIDTIIVEGGGGTLDSGSGIENLTIRGYTAGDAAASGNELNNVIRDEGPGASFISGGGGNDTLIGNDGVQFFAFGGDDGHEVVDGGGGNDWLFFEGGSAAVTVDFRAGTVTGGSTVSFSVMFVNVEGTIGTLFNDVMIAGDSGNQLSGYEGNDTLTGGAGDDGLSGDSGFDHPPVNPGNDRLSGGAGNDGLGGDGGDDWLDGGTGNDDLSGDNGDTGADSFAFTVAPGASNADRIDDFVSAEDRIVLDGTVHANSGPSGRFTASDGRFAANSSGTAQDSSDRVVYNTSSGELWYDADGNGAGSRQLIATLVGAPTLGASNMEVINGSSGGGSTINGTSGNDTLTGTSGNDTINGLAGNDTLIGLGGDDSLIGGAGLDSMDGGLGNDTYVTVADEGDSVTDAGGIDTIIVEGGGGTLASGSGIENLTIRGYDPHPEAAYATGNELDNVIRDEGPGTSSINGEGGNDTLIGSNGGQNFSFWGNVTPGGGINDEYGHDFVDGGGGKDVLFFDSNSVAVTVDFRNGTVTGGSRVAASVTFTNIEGALGTRLGDVMFASDAGNELWGWAGDDTVTGGAGADSIIGDSFVDPADGFGNDRLLGGGGNDQIHGEEGDDWIDGGAGSDNLFGDNFGGGWADSFAFTVAPGASNADTIFNFVSTEDRIVLDGTVHASSGPSGRFTAGDARFAENSSGTAQDSSDRVVYNTGTGELWYDADGNGAGGRQLIATLVDAPTLGALNIEVINGSGGGGGSTINGTSGNDTLTGTAGNDTINGLGGNDLFVAGSTGGADVINGGTGTDSIEFRDRATSGVVVDFGAGTITGGSSGTISFTAVERVVASNFADSLTGAAGGQTLTGQGGADTLWGGGGVDTLWGAGGNDAFVFREMGSANADRVSDFASGADKLQLDDAAFTSIGAMGNFAAGDARFWASSGGAAHDSNDRVLYNTSTGQLYYDADGNGSGAAQLIATVLNAPGVAATDIVVI